MNTTYSPRFCRHLLAGFILLGTASAGFGEVPETAISRRVTTAVVTPGDSNSLPAIDLTNAFTETEVSDTQQTLIVPETQVMESPIVEAPAPVETHQTFGIGARFGLNGQFWQPHQQGCQPGFPYACRVQKPCAKFGDHQTGLFGEFLYLTARGANVPYATPVTGLGANALPIGQIGVLDPDYEAGFRAGFWIRLNTKSSLGFRYTMFESETSDGIALPGGAGFVRSELTHPNTANVANDSLSARATYDIDFDYIDFDFKRLIWQTDTYVVNYVLGIRYANLNQDLNARYTINGSTAVQSEIDFDGWGSRVGLTGDWLIGNGFYLYGNGFLNFLAGQFAADFRQSNIFAGSQASTGYEDDRFVTQIDSEIGIGWRSRCGGFRLAAGFYSSVWFNTITTQTYLGAVRTNDYTDMSDIMTFDGMTIRAELRW